MESDGEGKKAGELAEILARPTMDRDDVEKAHGVGRSKAAEIMADCRKAYGGSVPACRFRITTESYLRYCGYPEGTWLRIVTGKGRNA